MKALATERKIESRVRFLDYAPEDIVNDHYEMADLFVYLSDYEGFGIPPLEAMSYRVPVILSPTSALDMIFQESACFLSEIDSELLAQTIRGLFDNPEELRRLSEAGLQLSRRYTWDQTASIISQDWERLIAAIR